MQKIFRTINAVAAIGGLGLRNRQEVCQNTNACVDHRDTARDLQRGVEWFEYL